MPSGDSSQCSELLQTMKERLDQPNNKVLLDALFKAWEELFLTHPSRGAAEDSAQAEELFRSAELRQKVEEHASHSEEEPGRRPAAQGGEETDRP